MDPDSEKYQLMTFPSLTAQVIISTLHGMLSIVSSILSIFFLTVLLRSERLRTLENSLLIHLVLVDALLGISSFANAINFTRSEAEQKALLCFMYIFFINLLGCIQLMSFVAYTADRFLKIVYPFVYIRFLTKRNVTISICLIHVLSSVATCYQTVYFEWQKGKDCIHLYVIHKYAVIALVVLIGVLLLVVVILNMKIMHIIHRQRREIMSQNVSRNVSRNVSQQPNPNQSQSDAAKTGKTLALLTLFTMVSYLPYWIPLVASLLGLRTSEEVALISTNVGFVFWVINFIADSVTLMGSRNDIKDCVKQTLASLKNKLFSKGEPVN